MAETRSCPIMVNIEPTYYEALTILAAKAKRSTSGQGRALIIEALKSDGIISDEHIAAIARGSKVPPLNEVATSGSTSTLETAS